MNVMEDLHGIENNWYMKVNSMEELTAAVREIAHHIPFEEVDINNFLDYFNSGPVEFPVRIGINDGRLMELGLWHSQVNEVKLEFKQTLEVVDMNLIRDVTTIDGTHYYTDALTKAKLPQIVGEIFNACNSDSR